MMPTFVQPLCIWLESLHFQCKAEKQKAFFCRIQVFNGLDPVMEITFMETGNWQKYGSLEQLQAEIESLEARRKNGVRSIILWDDFWITKTEIIKSRISAALGISQKIPARLTTVRRIDKATAASFNKKNHLNGDVASKYRYGLFLPATYFRVLHRDFQLNGNSGELLVAVATFSRPRIFQRNSQPFRSYELIRFASLLNSNVVGGLDKLLHAFMREREPDDLMTYADLEWSNGSNYEKLGFKKISQIPPIAFYVNTKKMERSSVTDHWKEANAGSGETITVYNAGSIKYVKTLSS